MQKKMKKNAKKVYCHDLFEQALAANNLKATDFARLSGIHDGTITHWKDVKNIKKQKFKNAIKEILHVEYDDLCVPLVEVEQPEPPKGVIGAGSSISILDVEKMRPAQLNTLSNTEPVDLTHYESDEYDHEKQWPIIGSTRGGQWLETVESGYPGVGEGLTEAPDIKDGNGYALKLIGDSMEPEFPEGGIVLVSPSSAFVNGDFAVVIIESRLGDRRESCMKQVFKYKDHITLHSLNDRYKDVDIPDGEVIAIHKVIEYRLTKIKKYV